ncbi:hypothetical protein L1987_13102 [Smallanthus sonchifolius]|uniref:Uncharacterized protein n=1 Tax=Smallanthus sonchifolius TaxID=185202 RepID=A0ACB9JGI7_9ASTR|nr:hypothetical protein L1987_13102 [Smallanthus sonchifolius]
MAVIDYVGSCPHHRVLSQPSSYLTVPAVFIGFRRLLHRACRPFFPQPRQTLLAPPSSSPPFSALVYSTAAIGLSLHDKPP